MCRQKTRGWREWTTVRLYTILKGPNQRTDVDSCEEARHHPPPRAKERQHRQACRRCRSDGASRRSGPARVSSKPATGTSGFAGVRRLPTPNAQGSPPRRAPGGLRHRPIVQSSASIPCNLSSTSPESGLISLTPCSSLALLAMSCHF